LTKTKNQFLVKKQKLISFLIVFAIIVGLITLTLILIVPAISGSISFFIANMPVYYENIVESIQYVNSLEMFDFVISPDGIMAFFVDWVADFNVESLASPLNALMAVPAVMFNGALAFISSIYILVEKDKFKGFLCRMLKVYTTAGISSGVIEYAGRLNKNFREYVRAQTIDGMILGTLATIQLAIVGSPYALLLGIMLGIVNYIPYFGSIFGSLTAVLIVAFTQGFGTGAIVAVTLLITQQMDANVIQPRLMSGSFSLSPLLVIISITVGGAFAGILGMVAAIPIVAVLKEMYDSITAYYERKKFGESGGERGEKIEPN
jgi:predicted PurR-regulated permease PerM